MGGYIVALLSVFGMFIGLKDVKKFTVYLYL